MSTSDELEAQTGLSQSWFGTSGSSEVTANVPVSDLTAGPRAASGIPAASGLGPLPAAADLPRLPPVPPPPVRGEGEAPAPLVTRTPEETERWQAVIASYEREAKALGTQPRAAGLYLEIGRIWEEQLGKQRNAAMCYQRAFHLAPKNLGVLHASRRLFTEVGNWGMVVQILQAEIEATTEPERQATLLAEKGTLLEGRLKNPDEALKAFQAALSLSPAEPLALESIEQVHLVRREHEALYRLYLRALDATDAPARRLSLLLAAAQIAEDRLDRRDEAIVLFERALELTPDNAAALAALRRLYAQAQRWEHLAAVLRHSATSARTPEAATALLMQAARIQHDRLGAADQALFTLLAALERAPGNVSLLREIGWLYEANEKHDEVAKVVRFEIDATPEARDRVPLLFRLGTLLEERLGRHDEAIAMFEEAVRLLPTYKPALHGLGRLYERSGRWAELARLYEVELGLGDEDVQARTGRLFKLAEILEQRLSREDDAIKLLVELLRLQPGYPPALDALERLYGKLERHNELVALYEVEVGLSEDVDRKVYLWSRIGQILEDKLQALDPAAAAFEKILELTPGKLDAIRTLERLHERRGRWADVLRTLELEVDATSDQNEVVGILHRAGRVQEEQLRDVPAAIATYEKVLTLLPTYLPALRSLGRLYHREGRWEDLIAMYRREMEVSRSDERATGLLMRIAEIASERLKNDDRAVEVYRELLARSPGSVPALKAMAEIHRRRGDLGALSAVMLAEASHTTDVAERTKSLYAVAEMYEHRLGDATRAAELHGEVLRVGHHPGSIEALVRIHSAHKAWPALVEVLELALERTPDTVAKAHLLVRLAEVTGDRLGRPQQAAERLEAAQALAPDDAGVLRQLERVYLARRDWERALVVGERLAAYETDPRQYAARQVRLGAMRESDLDPPQSGAGHYLAALEQVPGHPVALRALEIAYRRAGAWDGLAALYQREAMLTREPERRAGLYFRAADLLEQRAKRDDLALPMYRAVLESAALHVPAMRALARLAERRGDGPGMLEMIRLEADTIADPERTLQLLVEAGEIYQDKVGDVPRAVEAFAQVLARQPRHAKAFHRLESIYSAQSAAAPLIQLLVARAEALDTPDDQAELYAQAARVAQEQLADRGQAIKLYREVLDRKPLHAKALQRIGPLLVEAEDWNGALDAFHKLVSVTADAGVRAQGFRALGTLYEERKDDLVKAVQSYQHAVQADPSDAESLRRLARVYKTAEDWSSSVNVLLRLAEVQREPAQRIVTLLELGNIYEVGFGDLENASLALQKALEIDPVHITAILRLADLYERAGDWRALGQVAEQFARALPAHERRRAVPLQIKMADVYEHRLGDDAKAGQELRQALEVEPQNARALEMLARLYAKSAQTFPQAVDIHRRLLRLDPFRVESYHDMRRMFEKRGEYDKAFVCCEILVFLRAQQQDEDLFFHEHKGKVAPIAERNLSPEDHERLLVHPDERGVARAILEVLGLELSKAYPADLAPYELNARTDKHGPRSDLAIRKLADSVATVLGAPLYDLWVTKKHDIGLFLENEEVPALIVGAGVMRRIQERELRFLLARQLERVKAAQQLWFKLPASEVDLLVWGAAKLARPDLRVERDALELDNMVKKLTRFVSRRGRKSLDELAPRIGTLRFDVERHRTASLFTANRAGLALSNDVEIAVRALARDAGVRAMFADASGARETIGQSAEVRELLAYAVSEEYFAARAKLGFSIQS